MKLISLTQGRFAKVDDADYERVSALKWFVTITKKGTRAYAGRKQGRNLLYMHRFLTDAPQGLVVDHVNGDTLDNRRVNLRVCEHWQNLSNSKPRLREGRSSNFKGVYFDKKSGLWVLEVKLKAFATEEEAARAYDQIIGQYQPYGRKNFSE